MADSATGEPGVVRAAPPGPLPEIITDSDTFLADPNGQLGCPRARIAKSHYGVELLAYDLVREAFLDPRMTPRNVAYFAERGASPLILEFLREGNLNFMAPEKHDRIRSVMGKAFTRPRIEGFRPRMRAIAQDLAAGFLDAGACDLVGDFCHQYPISVVAQFIGVPAADVPRFSDATVQLRMLGQVPFKPGIPALEGALSFLRDYMAGLVAERRARPQDDFIDALIALQAGGEKIGEEELVWGLAFLLLGGHDTTRFTLASILHSLIDQGAWETMAAHPEQIPDAVTEGMRVGPGTPRQIRVVAEPLVIEGQPLQAGDVVSLNLTAAGRDPDRFEAPDAFRCQRDDPPYLVGFGSGRHVCIGQLLARMEMAEAVAVLTAALTDVAFDGPCRTKPTGVIGGFDSLPVRFRRRAPGPGITGEA
jgi:cytochrome P450